VSRRGGSVLAAPSRKVIVPALAAGTFSDPSSICDGAPTVDADGYLVFAAENPGNASATPHLTAHVSWQLQDLLGHDAELDLDDIFAAWLRTLLNVPPVDVVLWLAVTHGALGATSPGVAWKLEQHAASGQWQCGYGTNTGSSWTVASAAARSAKTVGALCRLMAGNDDGQARIECEGLDAADEPVTTSSVPAVNTGNATNGDFDTISLGFGFLTGTGGSAGDITARLDYALLKREQLSVRDRTLLGTLAAPSAPEELALMGQSNALDGQGAVDATYSGAAMPVGSAWVRNGTPVTTTYRTVADPVGPVPYIHANLANLRIVQRAGGGQTVIDNIETNLPALVLDYAGLAAAPEGLIYWQGEAETVDPAGSPVARYFENLVHYLRLFWGYYPDAYVYLIGLLMRDDDYLGVGASVHWPQVVEAQEAIGRKYASRLLLLPPREPTPPAMADVVHAEPSAAGFGTVIDRLAAAAGWTP
jgi:hypothetical protein